MAAQASHRIPSAGLHGGSNREANLKVAVRQRSETCHTWI